MTQDTKAPERVWILRDVRGGVHVFDERGDAPEDTRDDVEYVRADLLTAAEVRAEAAEAERDRLAKKLAVYEAEEAAYSARLQEHFRVKQQCDRCGHQSIDWLGENAACPRYSCSGGMVTLAKMEKTDND